MEPNAHDDASIKQHALVTESSENNSVDKYKGRRFDKNSFFEPMYVPLEKANLKDDDFQDGVWDFRRHKGPCRYIFHARTLVDEHGKPRSFIKTPRDVKFTECDFKGSFHETTIVFDACTFTLCDFSGTTFKNAKFSGCTFDRTSLTVTKFINCQFRGCTYEDISISGNETQLLFTDVTNPGELLKAATTNVSHLPEHVSKEYQFLRLAISKATFSRVILQNLKDEGSDDSYYDAVKSATLLGASARIALARLGSPKFDKQDDRLKPSKITRTWREVSSYAGQIIPRADYFILFIAGMINGWGRSISRTVSFGAFAVFLLFLTRQFTLNVSCYYGFVQTLEIFLIFGYTKHSILNDLPIKNCLDLVTALFGLAWYAVAASTVVSKITRVRG